jgi:hypothetical protein
MTFTFQSTLDLAITFTGEGDTNYDGIVDIYDAVLASAAYGSKPGDPNWNPDADLNGERHNGHLRHYHTVRPLRTKNINTSSFFSEKPSETKFSTSTNECR